MQPRPQTIKIYLPAGDPRGMRVAESRVVLSVPLIYNTDNWASLSR